MEYKDIVPYARISEADFNILSTVPYGTYVEVGTCQGASACAASLSAQTVTTIDIYDHQPKAYDVLDFLTKDRIVFFKGTSEDYAKTLSKEPSIDVLFIDGAHEFEYVTKDCEALICHVRKGGTVMFHDCNPNNPVTRVYEAVHLFLSKVPHKTYPKIEGTGNLLRIELL